MSNAKAKAPEVGMGATIILWSDRQAATIVGVPTEKTIQIQRDRATRTDSNGMSEDQSYTFEPNTEAMVQTFTFRKTGRWVAKGQPDKFGSVVVYVGHRDEYKDPTF